jgi:hypothetical protein
MPAASLPCWMYRGEPDGGAARGGTARDSEAIDCSWMSHIADSRLGCLYLRTTQYLAAPDLLTTAATVG